MECSSSPGGGLLSGVTFIRGAEFQFQKGRHFIRVRWCLQASPPLKDVGGRGWKVEACEDQRQAPGGLQG